MSDKDIMLSLAEHYESTVIRALVGFVKGLPYAGMVISGLDEILLNQTQRIHENRSRKFFDELASNKLITEELFDDDAFIHKFSCTYRAAIRTHQMDKIHRFARLLISSVEADNDNVDIFEEYLNILDDLSEREFYTLKLLRQYEIKYYEDAISRYDAYLQEQKLEGDTRLFAAQSKTTEDYWDEFLLELKIKYDIEENIAPVILQRLIRTGLYHTLGITSLGWTTPNKQTIGQTSPLFHDFIKWIEVEDKNI